MIILGIESSCDETACAIVEDGYHIRANIIASQIDTHRLFGGVVPEIASRCHVGAIVPVIEEALETADCSLDQVDAIAVTAGPGLVGSLLVGLCAAKGLSLMLEKPLLPIHHIAGHIAANYLVDPNLKPPFLCLVASGGHTHLIRVIDDVQFELLGATRDDAAGEAFDKIARSLELGYPGGPAIAKAATQGNPQAISFPKTHFKDRPLDFSFSGVKTACLNYLNQIEQQARKVGKKWQDLCSVNDIAASFQAAIVEVLSEHVFIAAADYPNDPITLAGGVGANVLLRTEIAERAKKIGRYFVCPPPILCTDNAAMIAAMGAKVYASAYRPDIRQLDAVASLSIDRWLEAFHYETTRHKRNCQK